ncbi:hypothetical protein HZB60_01890 [candidate division KSB1 bacterium]|nr:hypothetical protein [candidate division KSB1 bacterium]
MQKSWIRCLLAVMLTAQWSAAVPARPTGLQALHRDGQTFLTWDEVSGAETRYNIYSSGTPIIDVSGLSALGNVDQNSSRDARGQTAEGGGAKYFAVIPNLPLSATKGLFVNSAMTSAQVYYAVTSYDGGGENDTVVSNQNTLALPVSEQVHVPTPVLQRTVVSGTNTVEVYVHWASDFGAPSYPALANIASVPFHFGLVRRGAISPHPLLFRPHARGGSYMAVIGGVGNPEEWTLALDDEIADTTRNTFWFGYHEDLQRNVGGMSAAPDSGTVMDFTLRRMDWTLDWALANLPVDSNRVYMFGGSMGALGSVFYALRRPERIAAIWGTVPKFDFSFLNDPNPANTYNTGGAERRVADRLWAPVATNLPASNGYNTYTWLNAGAIAKLRTADALPPLMMFNGKQDVVVGWAEKIHTYADYDTARQLCMFFFDQRGHGQSGGAQAWLPEQHASEWLYQFRRDLSYPGFSRCSANHDPGDGNMTSGDSIGALNAYLNFANITDNDSTWQVTLTRNDLQSMWGTVAAPESIYVDVTPRRLQQFDPSASPGFAWQVERLSDNAVIQTGTVSSDAFGLLTVPQVLVAGTGSRLTIGASGEVPLNPNAPPIYVSVVSHNEEPPGNPDYLSSAIIYNNHRTALVEFANMLAGLFGGGVRYNYQSDWNFLQAVDAYDTGTESTNNKNVVRWMYEDLGYSIDPHAHESEYNCADVAYLVEQTGVPTSHVVGGMIVLPPESSLVEYFRDTLTAIHYPPYQWKAEIGWGGGTRLHVNEDTIHIAGIWKPSSNEDFLRHEDNAPLPQVGRYESDFTGLQDLLDRAQAGQLDSATMHTLTLTFGQAQYVNPGFIDSVRSSFLALAPYVDLNLIRFVTLQEAVQIWRAEYDSSCGRFSEYLGDYYVSPPRNLTANRWANQLWLRWEGERCVPQYRVYGSGDESFGAPTLMGATSATWFTTTTDSLRRFYRVTASSE